MLIYWSTRATGPIIQVIIGIIIRQFTSTFLTVPLRFLKLLFELSYLFRQICYLIGISTSWLLPGLLCGVEGFRQPVLLAAVLVEPTSLCGVVGRKRPVNSLVPFAKLVSTALLGGPLLGPSPMCSLSLPGYLLTCHFGGCCNLGLVGSGCFLFVHFTQVGGVTRCDKMILKRVPSLCVRDIPELVTVTTKRM
jgi:hypothetical protein